MMEAVPTLFDQDLLEAVRTDPDGELGECSSQDLQMYLGGGSSLRQFNYVGSAWDQDSTPCFQVWVNREHFGQDFVSYWGWPGAASLLSRNRKDSLDISLDWISKYQARFPVDPSEIEASVDRGEIKRLLGIARSVPNLLFGSSEPWLVFSFLQGYARACGLEKAEPHPILNALLRKGWELADAKGLEIGKSTTWSNILFFERAGFDGVQKRWFRHLLDEVTAESCLELPPVEPGCSQASCLLDGELRINDLSISWRDDERDVTIKGALKRSSSKDPVDIELRFTDVSHIRYECSQGRLAGARRLRVVRIESPEGDPKYYQVRDLADEAILLTSNGYSGPTID